MIEIVNKHKHTPTQGDVYIGRGSALGNPFTGSKRLEMTKAKHQVASREEAISAYEEWLRAQIKSGNTNVTNALNSIWKKAKQGDDVHLVCYCAPKACHGDVIKKIIEEVL